MAKRNRADQLSTIEALIKSKRNHLPLAKTFVQRRDSQDRGTPGALSWFVAAHYERCLQLYLLFHAAASAGDFSVTRDSRIWARALGLSWEELSVRNSISRAWRWLEVHGLITRARQGRHSKITLLYDDGSGDAYEHPHDRGELYLQLPYAYWRDGWNRSLGLPELTVLLIGLSHPTKEFRLVMDRVEEWYGVSTSTWQRGVQGLVRANLLKRWHEERAEPLAPKGYTLINVYELLGPFARAKVRPRGKRS